MFGLAALLGAGFDRWTQFINRTRPIGDRKRFNPFSGNRPHQARHWHDLEVPAQADRRRAAEAKREDRADKLRIQTERSFMGNNAHHSAFKQVHDETQFIAPLNLNPFYIAK